MRMCKLIMVLALMVVMVPLVGAHRSDGQCQRIRLGHLMYPTSACSMPVPGSSFGIV